MAHEVLEGTPHNVSMVTGQFEDPREDHDLRMRHNLAQYRESVIDSALLQGDLMAGAGKKVLHVIKSRWERRVLALAAADPECIALEAILAELGHVAVGAPAQFHKMLRHYLGPEIAVPFDPRSELYEATAPGPEHPAGT